MAVKLDYGGPMTVELPVAFPGIEGLGVAAAKNLIYSLIIKPTPDNPFSVSLHAVFTAASIEPSAEVHGSSWRLHFSRSGSSIGAELGVTYSREYGRGMPSSCLGPAKLKLQGHDVRYRTCSLTADGTALAKKIDEMLTQQEEADRARIRQTERGNQALAKLRAMVDASGHNFPCVLGEVKRNYKDLTPTGVVVTLSQDPQKAFNPPVRIQADLKDGDDIVITSVHIGPGASYDLAALLATLK